MDPTIEIMKVNEEHFVAFMDLNNNNSIKEQNVWLYGATMKLVDSNTPSNPSTTILYIFKQPKRVLYRP
jgi:hypothetical protein